MAQLVGDMADQTSRLVKAEMRLAVQEMTAKTKRAGVGAGAFGLAGVLAFYGGAILLTCAVLGLATVLPGWLSALIVGGVVLVAAGIVALVAKSMVAKSVPPVPDDMKERVREDIDAVTHHHQEPK